MGGVGASDSFSDFVAVTIRRRNGMGVESGNEEDKAGMVSCADDGYYHLFNKSTVQYTYLRIYKRVAFPRPRPYIIFDLE